MKTYTRIILICIIFLAAFLRFWQLDINPPALSLDEVAWGYNAYSLGIDGKDEFGRFLPHDYFESFGDFKPPVYAYLDILPVKIFGLSPLGVRFPSAFFGVLTVCITYFLVKRLFPNSSKKEAYALMAAFVLSISPWHIMLSRAAFEANVATFFLVTGVWLFLAAVKNKKWYLILSASSFVLSMYTFNTSRIVAPLLVIALTIGWYKSLLMIKKQVVISAIVGFLLLLPTIGFLLSPNASLRFKEVNIFSNLDVVTLSNQQLAEDNNSAVGKILHNRRFGYAFLYLQHYFDNLSLNFLFLQGDGNPKFSVQSVGQMYLWDLIFFFLGMLYLFKLREKHGWVLPVWILVGIIPAATARETPHALRIETTLPAFQILVAYGFINGMEAIRKKIHGFPLRNIVVAITLLLLCWNVSYFLHEYFVHYPKRFSPQWQYGYKEAITYALAHQNEFNSVYIPQELGRPYIYLLFYTKYSPQKFREKAEVERDSFGFVNVWQVGKYMLPSSLPPLAKGNLYIISLNNDAEYKDKVPQAAKVLKTIYRPSGKIGLVLYTL